MADMDIILRVVLLNLFSRYWKKKESFTMPKQIIDKLLHKRMLVEVEKIQEHTGRLPKDEASSQFKVTRHNKTQNDLLLRSLE